MFFDLSTLINFSPLFDGLINFLFKLSLFLGILKTFPDTKKS